ncbi:hypothetical protein PIB30_060209 [Stylosanthes scabra]|uniref:Uncharacterized protein n=1 Tax=Stylosanthes scabra TaxID=79078 RepID=A0ABU6YKT4_9FABA|nr:hypothetical protein [Stylosanthes scabra]
MEPSPEVSREDVGGFENDDGSMVPSTATAAQHLVAMELLRSPSTSLPHSVLSLCLRSLSYPLKSATAAVIARVTGAASLCSSYFLLRVCRERSEMGVWGVG